MAEATPRLSIIIPAYNAEAVLPLCLSALMPGLEIGLIREVILVDGGGEDQTRRLAEGAGATVITGAEKGRAAQLHALTAPQGAPHARRRIVRGVRRRFQRMGATHGSGR